MKKVILSLSALLLSGMLYAQEEKQNAVVNVENDYNPVVVPVKKKSFTPKEESNEAAAPLELKFSKQANPFDGFTSERDVKEFMPKQDGAYNGYARLGIGTGNSIDMKAAYNFKIDETSELKAFASFDGFKTKVNGLFEDHEWKSRMFGTMLDADYPRRFRNYTLNLVGNFNQKVFNYQDILGLNGITNKQKSTTGSIYGNITSQFAGPFSYKAHAGIAVNNRAYSAGTDKGINEIHMNYGGTVAYELSGNVFHKIGADIKNEFYFYNSRMCDAASEYRNILSLDVDPYTNLTFNGWKIKAGLKMNLRSKGGPAIAVAPDVTAEGDIAKGIGLFMEVKGGRVHNGFAAMNNITPYWNYNAAYSVQPKPTYKPIDILLAARISRFEPLSLEAYMGYAYIKNDILQICGDMLYDLIYVELAQQDTRNFYIGAKAGYDYKGWLNLSGDLRFSSWDGKYDDLLIMKPRIIFDLNAEVRPVKDLSVRVGYNFTQYTKGENVGRLRNKNDLYMRASYQINDRFGAFVQGNNLLDNDYFDYAGYETRGIRCMAGATMNF